MSSIRQKPKFQKIYPNIFRLRLPLPGTNPGPVNVYLFKGEKNVLLDTGPKQTVNLLEEALAEIGCPISAVSSIILTHGHPDHYGGVYKLSQRSGAEVKVHEDDKRAVETGWDVPVVKIWKFLRVMGVPLHFRIASLVAGFLLNQMVDRCRISHTLCDGEKVSMGSYTGTVISTPGHSRGSICIYLEEEGVLFSGDHILEHISPNPIVMLDDSNSLPKRQSQAEFYSSIDKIKRLNPRIIYPGHGREITDLLPVIEKYRSRFEERQEEIYSIVSSRDCTAYEIAKQIFPNLSSRMFSLDIFLSVSEVFTHLQVLEKDKKVAFCFKNERLSYRAV